LTTEGLTDHEIVTTFVQVQFLTVNEGKSKALESLSRFQMRVLFGQMHQVKALDCLQSETEDFESDGGGYASDNSEYTGESHDQSNAVETHYDSGISKYNILTK
jgi:hypothetical protein